MTLLGEFKPGSQVHFCVEAPTQSDHWTVCAACLFKPCSKQSNGTDSFFITFFSANIWNSVRAEESLPLHVLVLSSACEKQCAVGYFSNNWFELKHSETPSIYTPGPILSFYRLVANCFFLFQNCKRCIITNAYKQHQTESIKTHLENMISTVENCGAAVWGWWCSPPSAAV